MATSWNMSKALAVDVAHWCFDDNVITRPTTWTAKLLTVAATASDPGTEMADAWYTAQACVMEAQNDVTNPGVMWNAAKESFGTPETDGTDIVGLLLEDDNDTDRYFFYTLSAAVATPAGAEVNIPINQLTQTIA